MVGIMKTEHKGKLLKIYIDETDQWHGEPLYHAVAKKIREHDLSGVTIIRGIEGFGAHHTIHTARILRLSEDLPVVIEVVDTEDKIAEIIAVLDTMISEGVLALVENVDIITYAKGKK